MPDQVIPSAPAPEPRPGVQKVPQQMPTAERFFNAQNAFQQSFALKGAIELDLFTAIGEGNATVDAIARRCHASTRGTRILCDYLTADGFLEKKGGRYTLSPDSAAFLDRRSPAYLGSTARFLLSDAAVDAFRDVAGMVRRGSSLLPGKASMEPDNPIWVEFARSMAPLMRLPSELIAEQVLGTEPIRRVLDVAAGHGLFGIAVARHHPEARVVAVDWPAVLAVAKENAEAEGVADRYEARPGDAFSVDFGVGYDVVLLTNFLHHFDVDTNVEFLSKVAASMRPGGRAVILEFVPNEDRVSPPVPAKFGMIMLAMTPSGEAYTFSQYQQMLRRAGFTSAELRPLPPTFQQIVLARR